MKDEMMKWWNDEMMKHETIYLTLQVSLVQLLRGRNVFLNRLQVRQGGGRPRKVLPEVAELDSCPPQLMLQSPSPGLHSHATCHTCSLLQQKQAYIVVCSNGESNTRLANIANRFGSRRVVSDDGKSHVMGHRML